MTPAQAPARYRFSVEEWRRMGEAGILGEDDRVELIDGEVVEMSPIGTSHAVCVNRLLRLLVPRAGDRAVVRVQDPAHLDEHSEPQPDVTLARPPLETYLADHPGPDDLFLVIEVADTTLRWDLGPKSVLYARSGVVETWVVDLPHSQVVVLTGPGPDGYTAKRVARRGEVVEPAALAGVTLGVDEILG
ncbi:MAG: Uma2 family endonuclease [Acidimicrobiales bacterium]